MGTDMKGELMNIIETLLVSDPDVFLVDLKIKPTNNIKVFLDADTGMSIDRLLKFNRKMVKVLEETALYEEGEFSLEVSSPGLDEPLKTHRQFLKNIGRQVEIVDLDGGILEGILLEASEEAITTQHQPMKLKGKGVDKKAEPVITVTPMSNIKSIKVAIII